MTTHSPRPFSIRIFLPDGTPDGVRILEKSNWTGCGLSLPRSVFPRAKRREELGRTGVYILVGPSDNQGLPTIYIGQGDVVRDRLEQHYSKKDFWTWAVLFVSKDESLNRAHVQHLEARLIELAREAKRATLDNNALPQQPHLSEADRADVESFLHDMLSILPVVGLTAFEKPRRPRFKRDRLAIKAKGVRGEGYESAEGFVVLEGSQAVTSEVDSIHDFLSALRRDLVAQRVLVQAGETYRFAQDYSFSSPSTAAGVILGRVANGRVQWKDRDGRTLKEIQEAAVPARTREDDDP